VPEHRLETASVSLGEPTAEDVKLLPLSLRAFLFSLPALLLALAVEYLEFGQAC